MTRNRAGPKQSQRSAGRLIQNPRIEGDALQPRKSDEKSYAFAIAMLFALATLWSLSYTLTKIAVVTIPPITLTAIRATIAGLLLLLVMRLQGAKLPRDPKLRRQLIGNRS